MQYVKYNPTDEFHKSIVGAVEENVRFGIRLQINQCVAPSGVTMVVFDDDNTMLKEYPMYKDASGDGYDNYLADLQLKNGLYWYYFRMDGVPYERYIGIDQNRQASLYFDNVQPWQLSVFKKVYQTPSWLNKGVMYQIMVDRFHKDGTTTATEDKIMRHWGDQPFYREQNGVVKNNDFFFMPRSEDASVCATVAELCCTRLPKTYGEMAVTGTQVIVPTRKGEAGTEHLNLVLQEALNPPSPKKKEHKFRDLCFREGDRVMQIRNNYDMEWERADGSVGFGIFNGDIGVVEEVRSGDECLRIRFEDRYVDYEFSLLEELEMAYAVTVHKSQGSEYPIVILPLGNVPYPLLSRNLLYTAVTRAQSIVIVVGREDILRTMVENNRQSMRYTGLTYRLREMDA